MSKPLFGTAAIGALWLVLVIASYFSGATHVWADVAPCTACDCKNVNYWSTGDGRTYGMFDSAKNSSTNYPEAVVSIYANGNCKSGGPVQGNPPQTVYKWDWTGRDFTCGIQNGDSHVVECNIGTGMPTYLGEGATTQLVCSGS